MGWLIAGILMLVMATWMDLLTKISNLVGSATVTSTLFFLGILFLVVICLHFSIRISNLTSQVKKLSQWLAILNHEVNLTRKGTHPIGNKPDDYQTQTADSKTDKASKESVLINENFKDN
jgi:predicted PurR-regulated permease PerM